MDREHEEQAELFHDSWNRLSWVEYQVRVVRKLVEQWQQLPTRAPMRIQIDEATSTDGSLEFVVDVEPPLALPREVNFLIGNIVTDARSCLDMAIDGVWSFYSLERKGVIVQFPLEDNFTEKREKDLRTQRFLDRLGKHFARAIEEAQPNYYGGLVHVPGNLSAILINKLSNANKHRNITPVVERIVISSYGTGALGLKLRHIDGNERRGIPPVRFLLEYDISRHSSDEARRYINALQEEGSRELHIEIAQYLMIDGQEISIYPPSLGGRRIESRAKLEDFLRMIPGYIRLTLRNLNRTHAYVQSGTDDDFLPLDESTEF